MALAGQGKPCSTKEGGMLASTGKATPSGTALRTNENDCNLPFSRSSHILFVAVICFTVDREALGCRQKVMNSSPG